MSSGKTIGVSMDYSEFEGIFNKAIFERSKPTLLEKIANRPERYVGIFRPTKPKGKLIQNLLQSHEIKFGDAFEILIEKYLIENEFTIGEKLLIGSDGENLELDQMCHKGNGVYCVEQKIRDDHDSTKRVGQIDNFEKKVGVICRKYPDSEIHAFFYFIDDSFTGSKKFYAEKIQAMSTDYGASLYLSYGRELFEQLEIIESWNEMYGHLENWKKQIPDIPNINFDCNPEESFDEIKDVEPRFYRKIFSNSDLIDVLKVLFPSGETLGLLANFFLQEHQGSGGKIYETLHGLCLETIRELKSR